MKCAYNKHTHIHTTNVLVGRVLLKRASAKHSRVGRASFRRCSCWQLFGTVAPGHTLPAPPPSCSGAACPGPDDPGRSQNPSLPLDGQGRTQAQYRYKLGGGGVQGRLQNIFSGGAQGGAAVNWGGHPKVVSPLTF